MIEAAFGKILQELRKEKGFSQEELAHKCSLDRTYISLLERGQRVPTITTLFKIANSLDITPEDLIFKTRREYENSK